MVRGHPSAIAVFSAFAGLFALLVTVVIANPSWLSAVDTAVTTEVAETHNGTLNRTMVLITLLGVLFGEVVLEDAGGGCPSERSVGSVVIVEVDEPVVGGSALGF